MPLETATYISDLVSSNPASSDALAQADDHMRLIKGTLKATFPNFTAAALSSTQAQIDAVAALLTGGVLRGNGAVPAGAVQDFAMASAPTGWLACDGQSVATATYPDLFAAIGYTWGGTGANFNVPNLQNRYRRHRWSSGGSNLAGSVGNTQNPANLAHTHAVSGNTGTQSADHSHTYSGVTGTMSANASHTHGHNAPAAAAYAASGADGIFSFPQGGSSATINSANIDHQHGYSGTTSGVSASHTHAVSITSAGGSSDDANESRPYSATFLTCIKT